MKNSIESERIALEGRLHRDWIEPTEEEARNGWTAETLTAYHLERKAAAAMKIDPTSLMRRTRPTRANSRYNPHRWR